MSKALQISHVVLRSCVGRNVCLTHTVWRKLHKKTPKTWKSWQTLGGQGNIILMGNPGSGKTTTGRLVGEELGRAVVDVDDDVLTPAWGISVASKLKQLGEHRFLEEEGRALLDLSVNNTVIALSGSNPLHPDSMAKVAQTGVVVYLDATNDTILKRQEAMKVDRIVGMGSGATLGEVIESRRNCYEEWHDLRVMVHPGDTEKQVAEKVVQAVKRFENDPGLVSTRGVEPNGQSVTFLEAVLQGLAPDGGIYVKASDRPKVSMDDLNRLVSLNIQERALRLLEMWIHPLDICPQELRSFLSKSYIQGLFDHPDLAPVVHLGGNLFTQELFHGPTASFKDWALQLMPRFFAKAAKQIAPDVKYLILTATSGDTGSATLDGFGRHASDANIGVMVLYPANNISEIQKHQTTTMNGRNVKVIGVDGDFDYCQQTVKKIFVDQSVQTALGQCRLSAANSINWGRLLPQTLYHASSYLNLVRDGHIQMGDPVDLCVPTGNFGNILSAFYAKEMGFPIRKLICASNINSILTEFIHTGIYCPGSYTLQQTISPSIDIIKSSNLERLLFHLSGEDPVMVNNFYKSVAETGSAQASQKVMDAIQENFIAGYATEDNTIEVFRSLLRKTGYLMDPHTSVGYHVATKQGDPNIPTVISGTAHYGKFVDSILAAFEPHENYSHSKAGQLLDRASNLTTTPQMNKLLMAMASKKVVHKDVVPADYQQICQKVVEFAHSL